MQDTTRLNAHRGHVRWGILGTGWVANEFAKGLRYVPNARLTAVGSRSLDKAEKFAAAFHVPHAHGSYEALVGDTDVDVVYIATPHSRHKTDCLTAFAAGKAVLCEKPFAMDTAEAEQVISAARRHGIFCMEAMWMRFMPTIRKAHEIVRSGAIGQVRMLTADFGVPTVYDPTHRVFNAALGGGALLDRGVYPLSLAFELFGTPTSVRSLAHMTQTGVDEHTSVLLRYADGQIAAISATLSGYAANEAVIIGTEGRLTIHEPLCRPDRITLRKAPLAASSGSGRDSLKQRMKSALKNSAMLRRMHGLLLGRSGNLHVPFEGNGYNHEAAEVGRCLAAGRTESSLMPLDETLEIMRTLDLIRAQWRKN
ncbi:MAG: Gfo/Idh/MocA family protein [Sulfuricaulis sp.]